MKDCMQYKGYYGSVHFNDEELILHGKIEKLVITNAEEFWSASKYLVIVVE